MSRRFCLDLEGDSEPLSLQEPLMPELGVVIDPVVVFDGIDVDEIKAFAQSGRVGQNFRVGGNAVYFSNDALAGFLIQHEIEEKQRRVGVRRVFRQSTDIARSNHWFEIEPCDRRAAALTGSHSLAVNIGRERIFGFCALSR